MASDGKKPISWEAGLACANPAQSGLLGGLGLGSIGGALGGLGAQAGCYPQYGQQRAMTATEVLEAQSRVASASHMRAIQQQYEAMVQAQMTRLLAMAPPKVYRTDNRFLFDEATEGPRELTFREQLQKETDAWLSPVSTGMRSWLAAV